MSTETTPRLDRRFSDPSALPPSFDDVQDLLAGAELYWLTTVRADGRPHVTPLVGIWHDGALAFCTAPSEQKHRNLVAGPEVVVTTGTNTWAAGTDVVVEGRAERVTGRERLDPLATAWRAKYGDDWPWEATDEGFAWEESRPEVFVVRPAKVIAFGKAPHHQTTYRP